LAVFVALCAESFIVESRRAESDFRESAVFEVSIVMAGFFAGLVSPPYPNESDRTPALVALSVFDRFDEQAAIAKATGTAPINFHLCIVAPS
jgi:hypothetical protein